MKRFALLLAAAAVCFTPALISPASAQSASVNIRVGDPGYRTYSPGYRTYSKKRVVYKNRNCRNVTVRTKRPNGTVVIKKTRRCG